LREVANLVDQIKPNPGGARSFSMRAASGERRPNLVVFFVDNMSPTRTGFLGYRRNPTTPNLDRIARNGTIFTQAYSSIPHTRLFNTSLLTGRFSHRSAPDRMPQGYVENAVTRRLHDVGYHVMAQNWFDLSRSKGFDPKRWGIDTYVRPPTPEEEAATDEWPAYSSAALLDRIERHLEEARRKNAPVFLWVHLINPHGIPRGPGQYRHDPQFAFGPTLDDRYDGAIASADQWFLPMQRLLEKYLVHPSNTYFVLGSDHGSGINRFRRKVSKTTWQDHVHVPLAIAGPDVPTRRVDVAVDSALDVSATLLDLAGITIPPSYDGISLLSLMTGEWQPTQVRPIVVANPPNWAGVVYGKKKLVKNKGALSLFDLSVDPAEQNDLADRDPKLARKLSELADVVLSRRMKARLPVRAKAAELEEPE
jgi:arylsulfatase A-like enzyme